MWTKRQLIEEAYSELALAGYVFDSTPEEQQTALRRMDSMLATWEARGVRLGYAFTDPTNLDVESGIPDYAAEPILLNLAIRLAPGNGKQISGETRTAARDGFALLLRAAAFPEQQQMPNTMPRGAGNKPWRMLTRPFFPRPDRSPTQTSEGGDLDITSE